MMKPFEVEHNGKIWRVFLNKDGSIQATCKGGFTPKEYVDFFGEKIVPLLKTGDKSP